MTNADAYKRSYSLADIARKLNRPRTTVQAWRDQFKPYLPTVSGTKGRTLRYEESALSIFELIARMKDDTEPPEMITAALKQNVNFLIVEDDDDDETPFIASIYENVDKVTEALKEQKAFNEKLTERLDQQEAFNRELLRKLDQQQRYVDERLKKRDEMLVQSLRETLDTKKMLRGIKREEERSYPVNKESYRRSIRNKKIVCRSQRRVIEKRSGTGRINQTSDNRVTRNQKNDSCSI